MVVNRNFCLLIAPLLIMSVLSCKKAKTRTTTKERFEKYCYITIPENVKVLEDTLYNMPPDYAVIYTLHISPAAMPKLIKSIKKSGHYHITVYVKKSDDDDNLQVYVDYHGAWKANERGYHFFREEGMDQYTMDLDTAKGTLEAWQGHAGGLKSLKKIN